MHYQTCLTAPDRYHANAYEAPSQITRTERNVRTHTHKLFTQNLVADPSTSDTDRRRHLEMSMLSDIHTCTARERVQEKEKERT